MKVIPLSDVVIIRRADQQSVSDGGIAIPQSDDFTEDIGEVVYVGKGKPHKCKTCGGRGHIPMQVKEGDRVIFSTNGHQLTKIKGEELIVLRQDSVIAVIEGDDDVSSVRGDQPNTETLWHTGGLKQKTRFLNR